MLTAALSVYNSCVYCNSRMLFGLAQQGNAPRALLRVNLHRGIPLTALAVSAVATALCVVINYVMPGKAFALLMALVVAALVINWAMICITHLKFRRAMQRAGEGNGFPEFRLSPDKLAVSAVSRRDLRGDVSDPGHPHLRLPDPGMAADPCCRLSAAQEKRAGAGGGA